MTGPDELRLLAKVWRDHSRGTVTEPIDANIAIASTFTVDALVPLLGGLLLREGCRHPLLRVANYNQLIRVCLSRSDEFSGPDPQTVVLLFRIEDLSLDSGSAAAAFGELMRAIRHLRATFTGDIIVGQPPRPRAWAGQMDEFARMNEWEKLWHRACTDIAALSEQHEGLYVVGLEAAITALGEPTALDSRRELLYRMPYTENLFLLLALELSRLHAARTKPAKKCIVFDCDNTIWGGIVGEDGIGGIELSQDFPGRAFVEFQRQLKTLRDSGILLAVCSKNNAADVDEVFDRHTSMVLKRSDVSVFKVDWRPKSDRIAEIAAELNIGTDALVFLDDSSFEIEEVRAHRPEVECIQVPSDPELIPLLLLKHKGLFDRLNITSEDRQRVDMVMVEQERKRLTEQLTSEDFLRSAALVVNIHSPRENEIARVVQLVNKSNQFNVTTRRYTADQIKRLIADENAEIFCVTVSDKFGEYGLVGVCILRFERTHARFDTLLMSCRVLGRGIETAMIAQGIELARSRDLAEIWGEYIPTQKNQMVSELFQGHGFTNLNGGADLFVRDTSKCPIPDYLKVTTTVSTSTP